MIHKTELFSLHILDLLELLHADPSGEGSLLLVVGGEEKSEIDFDDLCLVLRIVTKRELFDADNDNLSAAAAPLRDENVIPISTRRKGGFPD